MSPYSSPVERVRAAICAQLSKLCSQPVTALHESILIRDGLYCGRKFQVPGYEVVWFIEEDEIKVFGPCGNLLESNSAVSILTQATELDGLTTIRKAA